MSTSRFMDGVKHFSMLVWALPEGVWHVDDVPRSSPARATYIQCGGSTEAMTVEIRVTHEDNSYEQYAVAREPVADPEAWTTVSWDNGGAEPFTIQVHPEEVFTGEQAVPVFRAYIEDGTLPPADLLRRLDI
nr:NTP pyrophosphohydrolase [Actinomyces viscosus]